MSEVKTNCPLCSAELLSLLGNQKLPDCPICSGTGEIPVDGGSEFGSVRSSALVLLLGRWQERMKERMEERQEMIQRNDTSGRQWVSDLYYHIKECHDELAEVLRAAKKGNDQALRTGAGGDAP